VARKLDKMLVIDVESTCWEKGADDGQQSEIIEIGLCVIDLHLLKTQEQECFLIKPIKSKVSPFCHKLTTLTQEQLDEEGVPFSQACSDLISRYDSLNRVWASYGDYDRRMFDRQCRASDFNARYPFGTTHINIKNLFAIEKGLKREVGMSKALETLQIELEGTHHRGVDDALNIAKIACRLLQPARNDV
jgi:inhibitor of KinA sporulation pathway (predicted exonuclease)